MMILKILDSQAFDGDVGSGMSREVKLITCLLHFILLFQAKFYISDAAIIYLLKFMHMFLCLLNILNVVDGFKFPLTIHSLVKFLKVPDVFEKLVVCVKCNSVYRIQECIQQASVSKYCQYKEFPNSRRAKHCGCLLLKTVEIAGGKKILYPLKLYCYQSIVRIVNYGNPLVVLQIYCVMCIMVEYGNYF